MMSASDEIQYFSVGGKVPDMYLKRFSLSDGTVMEFNCTNGGYFVLNAYSNLSSEEIDSFRKAPMEARVLFPSREYGLPGCVFSTLVGFDHRIGPVELFFVPTRYPQETWRMGFEQHEKVNTVSFVFFDPVTKRWVALRFATMPVVWRNMLGLWWQWARDHADMSRQDRQAMQQKLDAWQRKMSSVALTDLWRMAKPCGYFGEPLPSERKGTESPA